MTIPRRAIAASLIAGALFLTAACDEYAPAHPDAIVAVEVYSGQENPVVPLDEATSEALIAYLDTKAADAYPTLGGAQQVGFDGLVVTLDPTTDALATVRVLPHSVYVSDATGAVRISDLTGTAFDIVWNDVKTKLEADVVDAVESAR